MHVGNRLLFGSSRPGLPGGMREQRQESCECQELKNRDGPAPDWRICAAHNGNTGFSSSNRNNRRSSASRLSFLSRIDAMYTAARNMIAARTAGSVWAQTSPSMNGVLCLMKLQVRHASARLSKSSPASGTM